MWSVRPLIRKWRYEDDKHQSRDQTGGDKLVTWPTTVVNKYKTTVAIKYKTIKRKYSM